MSFVSDVIRILTLDCRESSRLVSESLDRELRWAERVAIRLHRLGCWSCRRLKRQLAFLHEAAHRFDTQLNGSQASTLAVLSDEAKQKMKSTLRQVLDERPGS